MKDLRGHSIVRHFGKVLFDSGYIDSAWDDYEISIWSYFDGEYSGKWLFSFRAPSIGEVIL
jgi:hypothetical protein